MERAGPAQRPHVGLRGEAGRCGLQWALDKILESIEKAGDDRLTAKAAVMEADLQVYGSADEVFYRGLMDSLGYSANREPMRALSTALPLSQLLALPLSKSQRERAIL